MKKKIIALLCSVLVLVSVFVCTVSARPNDVSTWEDRSDHSTKVVGAGEAIYLRLMETNTTEDKIVYYNCFSKGYEIDTRLYWNDFTPIFEGVTRENLTLNGAGDITYNFSYTYFDDGGGYDYQFPFHYELPTPVSDMYYYHTIKYKVTFKHTELEPLYLGDVSLIQRTFQDDAYIKHTTYGFIFHKERELNYTIDVEFYDYMSDYGKEPLPMSLNYTGHLTINSVDNALQESYNEGKLDGFNEGYTSGVNSAQEWSLFGLVTAVITAPIKLINEAFNFDVFGVNVSSFIKLIITAFLVYVLIKAIMRIAGKS